ncbi:uncharacterized protein LOC111384391 [Olea europaea var. sylvestris]|uniref:uncharacterized protein LOC111384390 n=1 Tax=Olea europaea var. sylvestris TaxID=158386 RepID=UPI000C1CF572|nr:uncharacterized protein LOC111384390 [Olea europaea var. sylvestris]XP_022864436.1 uncharacterized protein LOC111384391 [Olea europaea var. sylvestris]
MARIYIYDIIFGSLIDSLAHEFSECMKQEFDMIHKRLFVKKFELDSKKHTGTLISTSIKLGHDPIGKSVNHTLYRSMICSLLYLIANRPDIAFNVGVCTRFQAYPKESYLSAVRLIIRYVNVIVDHEILYSRDSNLDLTGYPDTDWVGNADYRKSTSGGCFHVGSNLVA